jgi:hypothetical protein
MKALILIPIIALTLLLSACQTQAIKEDLAQAPAPAAQQIGQDAAAYLADNYPVEGTVWQITNTAQTPIKSAIAQALRQSGYEVVEILDNKQTAPAGAQPLAITSANAPGVIVLTLRLDATRLSRGYDERAGSPLSAWTRRQP